MRKIILLFLLGCCLMPSLLQAQNFHPRNAHYVWPTEASPYLSSTFGETRSSHFHAALDIKTWGRRGYKVFATRDGILYRIAIGPTGYGKVIYLKHDDGSYSVYAHLLAFNRQIQHLADSIRFAEEYRFEIDRTLANRNIRVRQGEVIGYSGASGIGPPHLHFELRTPSQKPFNPLLTNLSIEDTIAPRILGVSVEPLSPASTVEGKNAIYTKRAWKKSDGFQLGNIAVSGPVGLGVNVFDQSNGVSNVYAVYELSMEIDGTELFHARVDSFSYQETGQMFLDRVYPLLNNSGKAYQRMYRADGNSLSFYKDSDYEGVKQQGILSLSPGRHRVIIRATDFFGNTSRASLNLTVKPSLPRHTAFKARPTGSAPAGAAAINSWRWFNNWVTMGQNAFTGLTVGDTDSSHFFDHGDDVSVHLAQLDNLFINHPQTGPLTLHRMKPESPGIVAGTDLQSYAVFPEHTFYDTVSVGMTVHRFKRDSLEVQLIPDAYPLRRKYQFYVSRDSLLANTENLSFYRWNPRYTKWNRISTTFTREQIIGKTKSLGKFVALRDSVPPVLWNPRLRQRPGGQWLVTINARDNLSGLDYQRTAISVDGVRGIAEYEPEDRRFVYYHPDFKPSPSMKIEITAADEMGNEQTEIFYLGSGAGHTR